MVRRLLAAENDKGDLGRTLRDKKGRSLAKTTAIGRSTKSNATLDHLRRYSRGSRYANNSAPTTHTATPRVVPTPPTTRFAEIVPALVGSYVYLLSQTIVPSPTATSVVAIRSVRRE